MWGHAVSCNCGICKTLYRVFQLVRLGTCNEHFREFALRGARLLESELRDELGRCGISDSPIALGIVGGSANPLDPLPPPAAGQGTPRASQSNQPPSELAPSLPKSGPISKPPSLPSEGDLPRPARVKEEKKSPEARREEESGVKDLPEAKEPEEPKGVEKTPRKERSRSEKPSKSKEPRSPVEASSSKRNTEKRKRRSRSRRRRRRETSESPASIRGREKKQRLDKPPEPKGSPPPRQKPPEPPGPPPGLARLPPRPRQGPGWQGEIPYSQHPRWTSGANKGITKRAKQELHSRDYYRRR